LLGTQYLFLDAPPCTKENPGSKEIPQNLSPLTPSNRRLPAFRKYRAVVRTCDYAGLTPVWANILDIRAAQNQKHFMKTTLPYLLLTLLCGCGTGYTFVPYIGQQQNWTTQPGAYAKVVNNTTLYSPGQFPERPYIVVGAVATDSEGNVVKAAHDQHADAALIISNSKLPNGALAVGNDNFTWAIPLTKSEVRACLIKYANATESKLDADAYYKRGYAKQTQGDFGGAIADYSRAIELNPDYVLAYTARGYAKQSQGDFKGAIADSTTAIEVKPDFALAYIARGFAKQSQGDLQGALTDSTKAIALKPDFAEAYVSLGFLKAAESDLDGAIADFTKAIALKPDLAEAYINRGFVRYALHDFTDALIDFHKAHELAPSNDYVAIWLWLVRARLGEKQAATTELQTYLSGRANAKLDDWPLKIGLFLAGKLPEPEFLAAAKNANPIKEAGQLCEAYFYAGSKDSFTGKKEVAKDYFRKSIATEQKGYTEYISAVAELKSLETQKQQ
jgi:lipoprotein NlpI